MLQWQLNYNPTSSTSHIYNKMTFFHSLYIGQWQRVLKPLNIAWLIIFIAICDLHSNWRFSLFSVSCHNSSGAFAGVGLTSLGHPPQRNSKSSQDRWSTHFWTWCYPAVQKAIIWFLSVRHTECIHQLSFCDFFIKFPIQEYLGRQRS